MLRIAIADREAKIADALYRDALANGFAVDSLLLEALFDLLMNEKLVRTVWVLPCPGMGPKHFASG